VRVLEGRAVTPADTLDTPRVGVINATMARRYWPGQSAVGKRVMLKDASLTPVEIVGVVADHRIRTVGEPPQAQIHLAQSQRTGGYRVLAARTSGDAERLLSDVRRTLLSLEPNLVFVENQTMETQVAATLLPVRAGAWLVGVIGLVGATLAAIGLYGVMAFSVARRTREIGIRLAVGSTPGRILGLVARHGALVAAGGVCLGIGLAAGAAALIAGALYGVGVADPVAWGGAVAALLAVTAVANLVPAWRASRLNPVAALRVE
jgi:putative ABC transport system permease protein